MFSVDDLDQPAVEFEEFADHSNNDAQKDKDKEETSTNVVKKVRKSSTRPKLDLERLKGPRGLPVIEKLFSKTKFKGHGHEQEDLKTVMKTLHYWCHRLFPKWTFDDTLAHLERMGSKKPVMTLKKKILFNQFEEEPIIRMDLDPVDDPEDPIVPMNDFDLLFQTDLPSTSCPNPPAPPELTQDQKEMIAKNRLLATKRRKARFEAQKQKEQEIPISSSQETPSLDVTGSLTDEQKLQIEQNRLLAIGRRMNRLNQEQGQESRGATPDSEELIGKTMPDSHNLGQESDEVMQIMPESGRESRDSMPVSEELVEESRETIPDTEELVGITRYSNNLGQESDELIQIMPESGRESEDSMSCSEELVQESKDLINVLLESIPESGRKLIDSMSHSHSEELDISCDTPDTHKLVEESEELIRVLQESTPESEELIVKSRASIRKNVTYQDK